MKKTALFDLINSLREKHGDPPLDKESYIKALSSLEAQGIIETTPDRIYVLKEQEVT